MGYKFRGVSEYITDEDLEKLIKPFLSSLKSYSTKKEYYGIINLVADELECSVSEWDEKKLSDYFKLLAGRCDRYELSYNTYRSRMIALKKMYSCLGLIYEDVVNPLDEANIPTAPMRMYSSQMPSLDEIDCVLETSRAEPVYYLIFTLVIRMGLTVSELTGLNVGDVNRNRNGSLELHLKGTDQYRFDRYLPMPADVENVYLSYASTRRPIPGHEQAVFLTKHNTKMAPSTLQHNVSRILRNCGLSQYSLKDFRTRAIFSMLETGCEDGDICQYAGLSEKGLLLYKRSVPFLVSEKTPASLMNLVVKNPYSEDWIDFGNKTGSIEEEGDVVCLN